MKEKQIFVEPEQQWNDLGRRPANNAAVQMNPPSFVWAPQPEAVSYELELARNEEMTAGVIRKNGLRLNAYCGDKELAQGVWFWRVRAAFADGETSFWSTVSRFEISSSAVPMSVPPIEESVKRIPPGHPRLYLRQEELEQYRQRLKDDLKAERDKMLRSCEEILAQKSDVSEPIAYVSQRDTPEWTKSWRDAYMQADTVSSRMSELAFGALMTGDKRYLAEARRLLHGVLSWDVSGSSCMHCNDEAGMPILRHLARAYTFLHDALPPEERAECIRVMKARGGEVYSMLCPRILYAPFDSHANRMFYFLGEAAIAFYGDIPEAADWLEFVLTYFYSTYPVWGDEDGCWHEGPLYWYGYMSTFTDWAEIMQHTLGLNAFVKPFFKNTGNWLMMSELPGTTGFGWGDYAEMFRDCKAVHAMQSFAAISGNPYWQWYYKKTAQAPVVCIPGFGKLSEPPENFSYTSILRASYPDSAGIAPVDIPCSKLFRGNGIAIMNSTLLSAKDAVQVQMKCGAQFGTWSHGYESANSFTLNAFGERLLIRSGVRDCYGSKFHSDFIWETQSQNNLLFNGQGQTKRSMRKMGKILEWSTSPELDRVVGEASDCYPGGLVKRYTREILFRKPCAVLIIDRVETNIPVKIDFLLHALNDFQVQDQHNIHVEKNDAACTVDLMYPEHLTVTHTWETDPPIIDPEVQKLNKEYHLRAVPEMLLDKACFITLIRPYKKGSPIPAKGTITKTANSFTVQIPVENGLWVREIPQS